MMLTFLKALPLFFILVHAVPQVQLGGTLVSGVTQTSTVEVFRGIPFAEPPLGALRFRQPVFKPTLNGSTFNATNFGTPCLQQPGVMSVPAELTSEDCLSLNVYRPANVGAQKLPVLVFIHGGAFVNGASLIYDGSIIVNQSITRGTPMLFVTVNYRLVQLGFPHGEEAGRLNALNLGLHDQLVSLQWVHQNIAAFGGDPKKVTVSGESAGAYSVDTHVRGRSLKTLARAAVVESTYGQPIFTAEDGNESWAAYVSAIPECASTANSSDTFTCLQQVPTSSLLNAINAGSGFQPVIDGPAGLIPGFPSQSPILSAMPVLIGSNKDEGTLFTPPDINSSAAIAATIIAGSTPSPRGAAALAAAANKILELYPDDPALGSPFGTGNETFGLPKEFKQAAAITGDWLFQSRTREFATDLSKLGKPTFAYHFTDPDARFPIPVPGSETGVLGVPHGSELVYLSYFGPLSNVGITSPTAVAVSNQMVDYWISFVTSLDPNDGKGLARPTWPAFKTPNSQLMQLDGTNLTAAPANFRAEGINFINRDPVLFRR